MTPAAAEALLIGILAGFFVSGVMQQLAASRRRGLDEETLAQLEQVVEQALAKKIAAGGFVAAPPGVAAAGATQASSAVDTTAPPAPSDSPAEAAADTATDAPAATDAPPGAGPEGELVPLVVTTMDGSRHELQVQSGENLLDAALDRNVDLDYSCKDGSCDTCTVRILSGM